MTELDVEMVDPARRLLALAGGDALDSASMVAAIEVALARIHRPFAQLVGETGFRVALGYTLRPVAVQFPFLCGVVADPNRGPYLEGLSAATTDRDPSEVARALETLLSCLLGKFAALLGPSLTDRCLGEVLSDASEDESACR